jgi:dTDP-4-dehydrorhamnose reductase
MILITGSNGLLGSSLVKLLESNNLNYLAPNKKELDIRNINQVEYYFKNYDIDTCIHLAAYTSVDSAEDHRFEAYEINVRGTINVVERCQKYNTYLIFLSTDYVFDGSVLDEYETFSIRRPINYYGITKKLAEDHIMSNIKNYAIVRTSWLFDLNGSRFINAVLDSELLEKPLSIVDDEYGSPTFTMDLSQSILVMTLKKATGVFHIVSEGFISRYEFAKEIIELSQKRIVINKSNTTIYNSKAKRPLKPKLKRSEEFNYLMPLYSDRLRLLF